MANRPDLRRVLSTRIVRCQLLQALNAERSKHFPSYIPALLDDVSKKSRIFITLLILRLPPRAHDAITGFNCFGPQRADGVML